MMTQIGVLRPHESFSVYLHVLLELEVIITAYISGQSRRLTAPRSLLRRLVRSTQHNVVDTTCVRVAIVCPKIRLLKWIEKTLV